MSNLPLLKPIFIRLDGPQAQGHSLYLLWRTHSCERGPSNLAQHAPPEKIFPIRSSS
jgi:hypothetical protein